MQPNSENRLYRRLVNQLGQLGRERKIIFSQHSERLIVLSVEAWFEDPIRSNRENSRDQDAMERLAIQIFTAALEDQHISDDLERRGEVSFGSLLVSLSDAGKRIIGKGF